jgi:hypothetical protein
LGLGWCEVQEKTMLYVNPLFLFEAWASEKEKMRAGESLEEENLFFQLIST